MSFLKEIQMLISSLPSHVAVVSWMVLVLFIHVCFSYSSKQSSAKHCFLMIKK